MALRKERNRKGASKNINRWSRGMNRMQSKSVKVTKMEKMEKGKKVANKPSEQEK
jgi:hypothetical protein